VRALVLLATAVFFEALFAVMLKVSQGFTLFWPTLVTVVAYILSLVFLNLACKHFDISVAYAVWTGSAAAAVALIGVFVFHERFGGARAVGLSLVIGGVVVLLALEGREPEAVKEEQALAAPIWDHSVWAPGLDNDHQLLGEVYETMPPRGPAVVPWYVQVLESPASPLALPAATDRLARDCLHVVLGRGLSTQDHAFVRGFTLGASARCARWQRSLARFCARRL
jgi:multidrug transporter EmrE-like cation transporter